MASKKKTREIKPHKPEKRSSLKKNSSVAVWISLCVILILTLIAYLPSLQNDFTNWDDPTYVSGNPLVVNSSIPFKEIFSTPVSGNYHPLTIVSLAINYQTGKLSPAGYHFWNLLFHLFNTGLVFFFIFLLTRRNLLMAGIVSLFFGIHPMHVESVAWVSERKDVLYVFFFIAGLITYMKYKESKKTAWYIFTLLLFILSCLSKGMAVVFPFILLLIDYLQNIKWQLKSLTDKTPFVLLAIVFGIAAYKIQSEQAITEIQSAVFIQRIAVASYGVVMYTVKFFAPFKLSAFYPYPYQTETGSLPFSFYLFPVILIALIALVYIFLRKEKAILFGLLFYFVSIVMVLQFISIGSALMADRYSYLSSIGLLYIVAWLVNRLWTGNLPSLASLKYPVTAALGIIALIFSYQTYARTQVWKNSETLWTNAIENYPTALRAYELRGNFYREENEDAKALDDYNHVLNLNPDFTPTLANRGIIYHHLQQYDKAINDYKKAVLADPKYALAFNDLGNIYKETGKFDSALVNYNKAILLEPRNEEFYTNRAVCYSQQNKSEKALADFSTALSINPNYWEAYFNRGIFYGQKTPPQYDLSEADFRKSIQLHPDNDQLYNSLGLSLQFEGKYAEAIDNFSMAIRLNPAVPDYIANRSYAENSLGKKEEARIDALKAQQMGLQLDNNYLKELGIN